MTEQIEMKKAVLFVDCNGSEHLSVIQQVAELGYDCIVSKAQLHRELNETGVAARLLGEFAPHDLQARVLHGVKRIAERFVEHAQEAVGRDAFQTEHGNPLETVGQSLSRRIFGVLKGQIAAVEVVRGVLAKYDLRLLVLRSNMSGSQRALQMFAESRGIRVLELGHGHRSRRADNERIRYAVHCDYAAFGRRDRDILVSHGADPAHVHLAGAPGWDALYQAQNRMSAREARSRLGLDPERPLVLFATSYADAATAFHGHLLQHHYLRHRIVLQAIGEMPGDLQLIVRPHPGEFCREPATPPSGAAIQAYRGYVKEQGVSLAALDLNADASFSAKAMLVRAADVVISSHVASSLISEAMILGRPVIVLETEDRPFYSFYEAGDGVLFVDGAAALKAELEKLLTDESYRGAILEMYAQALPDLNHGHGGCAAAEVVQLIRDLASSASVRNTFRTSTAGDRLAI